MRHLGSWSWIVDVASDENGMVTLETVVAVIDVIVPFVVGHDYGLGQGFGDYWRAGVQCR